MSDPGSLYRYIDRHKVAIVDSNGDLLSDTEGGQACIFIHENDARRYVEKKVKEGYTIPEGYKIIEIIEKLYEPSKPQLSELQWSDLENQLIVIKVSANGMEYLSKQRTRPDSERDFEKEESILTNVTNNMRRVKQWLFEPKFSDKPIAEVVARICNYYKENHGENEDYSFYTEEPSEEAVNEQN